MTKRTKGRAKRKVSVLKSKMHGSIRTRIRKGKEA